MTEATPLVFKVALSCGTLSGPVRWKVTVPPGVGPAAAVTVAVSVKVWPTANVAGTAVSEVVVGTLEYRGF